MPTASRQLREGGFRQSLRGQHTGTLPYYVDASPEELKGNLASVEGLPALGTAHPDWPMSGMVAREYWVEPHGVDSMVSVVYSTANVSGVLTAVPEVSGGKWLWGTTYELVDVAFPVVYRRRLIITSGDTTLTKDVWDVDEGINKEKRTVLRVEWEIYNPDLSDIIEFETQINHIHEIGGYKYLLSTASIQPKDNLTYRVVVQWTYDDGTRYLPSLDPSKYLMPGDSGFPVSPPPPTGYVRDQYHKLVVLASDDPETTPPTLVQVKDFYDGDLEGWKRLPGVPNL